jgi:hypothetical protein
MHGGYLDQVEAISMKVFFIIKFSDVQLSIRVLVTSCRPIGILTTKGKFLSDNSMSGWSSDPNEISTLDHLILLLGTIC